MPVATRVPPVRRDVSLEGVEVGRAVAALTWASLGELAQYVRGRGAVLVPMHCPNVILDAAARGGYPSSTTLAYRTQPSGRAVGRIWALEVLAVGGTTGRATVTPAAGTAREVSAGPLTSSAERTFVLLETPAKGTTVDTVGLSITATAGRLVIVGVACWELPRAQLTKDATDLGLDLGTVDPDRPIWARDYESVNGVARAIAASDGRRVGLASWCGPRLTFASGTFADAFELPLRVVPPRVGPSDVTRLCSWDAIAWCDASTAGEIRIVTSSGTSSAVAVTATSAWWLSAVQTFAIACEDASDPFGLPGGTFATVQVEVRRTSGAGNVYLAGFNLWDGAW